MDPAIQSHEFSRQEGASQCQAVTAPGGASQAAGQAGAEGIQGTPSGTPQAETSGATATDDELTAPCRSLTVGKVDSCNKLRRLDELLEVARAKLVALAHGAQTETCTEPADARQHVQPRSTSGRPPGGHPEAAADAAGTLEAGEAVAGPSRLDRGGHEVAVGQQGFTQGGEFFKNAGEGGLPATVVHGAVSVAGAGAVQEGALVVAEILRHVAEASALVQGDIAERLHSSSRRCAQCAPLSDLLLPSEPVLCRTPCCVDVTGVWLFGVHAQCAAGMRCMQMRARVSCR